MFRILQYLLPIVASYSYCLPSQPCWPSLQEWNALNSSLSGRLMTVLPEAYPCSISPNSSACATVIQNFTNPFWRAAQPGAAQWPNWEEDAQGGNCFVSGEPCQQGAIPPVGVAVAEPSDVAIALQFAQRYNIRVVIKSTGHDFQGRSSGAGALLIWLHTLQGIQINPSFTACSGDTPHPAVTTRPGNGWGSVYEAVAPSFAVVGGSARTVSSAGGYTLGGGHSFMSPSTGLAVDNVLQMQVVLVNGSVVNTSLCSFPDLFWALRGGGAGTVGVVTSITYKLHPVPSQGVVGFLMTVAFPQSVTSIAAFVDVFLAYTPQLLSTNGTGGLWGGYFQISAISNYSSIELVYNGTMSDAQASMKPFIDAVASLSKLMPIASLQFTPYASMDDWHNSIDPAATGDPTGVAVTLGSRLIPLAACTNATLRQTAVTAITQLVAEAGQLNGHMVAGGAVAQFDRNSEFTSVTPAWRDAVWHLVGYGGWPLAATVAEQQAIFSQVSTLTNLLRDAFPDSGAYWSESDYLEPEWQQAFWGSNYPRLQAIKTAYDPNGVLTCHHCVEPASK